MKKMLVVIMSLACCALVMYGIQMNKSVQISLIPREILFGNPVKGSLRISPNGQYISYVAPVNNVLNVWIAKFGNQGIIEEKVITTDTKRGIRNYFWSQDEKQILYLQDKDGDENWHLYGISIDTQEFYDYTPFDNIQIRVVASSKEYPDSLLISINKEDKKLHDLYKLSLSTKKLTLLVKNPGMIVEYIADHSLEPRGAVSLLPDGTKQFLLKNNDTWEPVITWNSEDASQSNPIDFARDPRYIYLKDSKGANTAQLVKYDCNTGTQEILLGDDTYDVGAVFIDDDTRDPLVACIIKDKQEWFILNTEFEKDFKNMQALCKGDIALLKTDNKKEHFIVGFNQDTKSISYYLYTKSTGKGIFLFDLQPMLNQYTLAHMEPIQFTSRDGLTIHGYLTKPRNSTENNLPLILNVHGGPWVRDDWGYSPEAQWLANRGYAVLQVNYRGSSGYGKKFLQAGNKEWGGKMHNDLVDAVKWAIDNNIADPKKIAIYGGSYGGYAALVGATFTPDLFCCAVDIVGVSNLLTFLNSIPPYWESFRAQLNERVGNLETEQEFLKSRSPLFKVDNIKIPLLIAQGANDPRVKQEESEQIVTALKNKNIPYEYLLFQDEGHGFARPENRLKFYAAAEKFLATHLGGRCE